MGGRRPRPWYQPNACTLGSAPRDLGAGTGLSPWLQSLLSKAGPVESRNVRFWDSGRDWLLPFQGKVLAVAWGREASWGGPLPLGTRRASGLRASQASLGHIAGCWVRELTT